MTRSLGLGILGAVLLVSCLGRDHDPVRGSLVGTAIREFRDKKRSAEVTTKMMDLNPEELQALMASGDLKERGLQVGDRLSARLDRPRRTSVEAFVYKTPEFDTYFYRNKNGEVKSRALEVLLLSVDGQLKMAAYTSTGDPNKTAFNHTKKQQVRGSETTNGTYSVESLCLDCRSAGYDAVMRYSVFFIGGKFAIHETSQKNYGKLGQKASMGCVRLNTAAAKMVYETVQRAAYVVGGKVSYPEVTIHIADDGILDHFAEDEVLALLRQNFRAEARIR